MISMLSDCCRTNIRCDFFRVPILVRLAWKNPRLTDYQLHLKCWFSPMKNMRLKSISHHFLLKQWYLRRF